MRIAFLLLFFVATSIFSAFCQTGFSILLEKVDSEMVYLFKVPLVEIVEKNAAVIKDGFELIDLEVHNRECWGVWQKTNQPVSLEMANNWEAFRTLKETKKEEGFLLNDIEVVQNDDGTFQILGLWQIEEQDHDYWILPDLKNLQFHYKSLAKLGLYLQDIETIKLPSGDLQYVALYHRGKVRDMTHFTQFTSSVAFDADKTKRILSGYACTDIETPIQQGIPLYLALFKKSSKQQYLTYQMKWESLLNFQDHIGPQYKIVDIELNNGVARSYLAPFNINRMDDTPDSDMKDIHMDYSRADPAIKNQSIAFAASNALFWLSNNGFEKLNNTGSAMPTRACLSMAKTLAGESHMKTMVPNASSIYTIINGLHKFIDTTYQIGKIKYYSVETFNRLDLHNEDAERLIEVHDNLDKIPLEEAKEHFTTGSIMLMKWGLYQTSENGRNLEKKDEVWGTLVGYGQDEYGQRNQSMIIVHDPSDSKQTTQKYFSVRELDNYYMTSKNTKLVMSNPLWTDEPSKKTEVAAAKKQFLFFNNKPAKTSELEGREILIEEAYAVWESLLVIRLDTNN